ncbi:MAG: alpha-mannosidase [Ruminiclostridium sp.]|nr:alpha-mannosidase [Ruminiclostridium sp.]
MQIANAHFKSLDYWCKNKCTTLEDVKDFARCLENIGFAVMPKWRIWENSEELPKPSYDSMLEFPEYDLTVKNSELTAKSGWIAAELKIPLLAEMVSPEQWGNWKFEFNAEYDPDLYCDDVLIDKYIFRRAAYEVAASTGYQYLPHIFLRIPSPQFSVIGNLIARCCLTGLNEYNERIRDMARSLRVACELLGTENRRDNLYLQGETGINNSRLSACERTALTDAMLKAANTVNMQAALDKDLDGFVNSLVQCKNLLVPLSDYAKKFTVYFIGHSHIDLAWKWRWPETIECMKGTIETQLELMKREKDYVYVESSAVVWKALSEKYPELWEECRKAAENGQLEPQGAMWCEPDGMCVPSESWARQILYGQKAAVEYLGKESTCGFNIDAFGFNAGLPKIYKAAGIENFVTQKLRYNEYTIFPYIHFWWEGDDGSRILGLHVYPSHSNHIDSDEIASIVRVFHLTDGIFHIPVMWGYGNHGGGPQPGMMDRIEELKGLTVYPNLEFSGFSDYFSRLRNEEQEAMEQFPVIKGELFLETHHKTFTVQGKVKETNRECERRLISAEALAAIGLHYGVEYPEKLIHEAWQVQMFNQFHDVLPGTSLPSVYQDVFDDYDRAFTNIKAVMKRYENELLGKGNTDYVFNQLPWRRNAVVRMPADGFGETGILCDSRGNRAAYQKTFDGKEIVFIANDLPGMGFERFQEDLSGNPVNPFLAYGENWAENENIRVSFDRAKGVIHSLSVHGQELADGEIGGLNLLEDTLFRDYETWNMGFTGREFKPECVSFERIEAGPVRVVFRAKYTFGQWEKKKPYFGITLWHTPAVDYPTSFFTQDFILYAGGNRVECILHTDWWEDKTVLKVSAETGLKNTKAVYHVPFGAVERPTKRETPWEKARFEVPAGIWADLEDDCAGLAILNRSRHGYDALHGRLRLTLLTSPCGDNKNLVPDPLADRGRHTIEYAFYPHQGDYKQAQMHRWAYEYECPALILTGGEKPLVELGVSYLEINPEKMIVSAIKPAEDGKGIVMRGFEPYGNGAGFELRGKLSQRKIRPVNLREQDTDDNIALIAPHKMITVKLE